MTTIDFAWYRRDEVVKTVEKLARRAAKLGAPFTAIVSSVVTREQDELVPDPLGPEGEFVKSGRVLQWGSIELETPEVKYQGWTLLGVLTPIPVSEEGTETLLYPSAVPGQELPADVREWTFRCDHCGHERRRNETFVLRHESGELKQVGRQCIRDYLGHDADRLLSRYDFIRFVGGALDPDELGYGGSRGPNTRWRLPTILAATSAVVRKFGWVSAGAARAYEEKSGGNGHITPTKTLVDLYLAPGRDADELRKEVGPVTEEDQAAAEAAAAFWSAETGTSDYVQNAQLLVLAGLVIPRAFGLAVSLLPVAQNKLTRREIERREAGESAHVGTIGKRETFEVEVLGRREFESDFGTKTLVTLRTRDGALVKWWASGSDSWLPKEQSGEFTTIAATVKQHGEFKGRKETTVSRVAPPPAPKTRKASK